MRLMTVLTLSLLAACSAAGAPLVFLDPPESVVLPGDTLELSFRLGASADSVSGFQLHLSFDPDVVELVAATEGSLYVESGLPTWSRFEEIAPGQWHFFDTVMGDGTCILPPGELLHLEFSAVGSGLTTVAADTVRLADVRRNNLPPGGVSDASITVIPTSGVEDGAVDLLWLGPALPNPCRDGVRTCFARAPGRGPVCAEVYDVAGRLVSRLAIAGGATAGEIAWDCRADDGAAVPSGVYFLRVSDDAGEAKRAVVRVR